MSQPVGLSQGRKGAAPIFGLVTQGVDALDQAVQQLLLGLVQILQVVFLAFGSLAQPREIALERLDELLVLTPGLFVGQRELPPALLVVAEELFPLLAEALLREPLDLGVLVEAALDAIRNALKVLDLLLDLAVGVGPALHLLGEGKHVLCERVHAADHVVERALALLVSEALLLDPLLALLLELDQLGRDLGDAALVAAAE